MELEAGCFLKLVKVGDWSHFGLKLSRRAQESMASHNLAHRRVSSEADSVKVILRKEQREQGVLELQALKEPLGQSNRSTLLGATRGLSSRQQERLYSSQGRRWIMKHHFKGMPTMQVVLLVRLFSNACF